MKLFLANVKIFHFWPKTMDYSPWFDFWESKKVSEIRIPSERASQGEQNDANFSFVAPSSECSNCFVIRYSDDLYHACTFEV